MANATVAPGPTERTPSQNEQLLLSVSESAALLGVSQSRIYRLLAGDPSFPRPIRLLGPRSWPRWRRADLEAWVVSLQPEPGEESRS